MLSCGSTSGGRQVHKEGLSPLPYLVAVPPGASSHTAIFLSVLQAAPQARPVVILLKSNPARHTPIQPHRRLIRVINSSSCSVLCSVRGAKFQSRIRNKQTQPEGSLLRQTVALIAHSIVAILGQSLRVERSVAVGVFSSALYHKTKTVGKNQAVEMSWGGGGGGGRGGGRGGGESNQVGQNAVCNLLHTVVFNGNTACGLSS